MTIKKLATLLLLISVLAMPILAQDVPPIKVVATTTQAYDLMQILAGDTLQITGLMGAGVDPHLYKPTESDISAMNQAQLVVYSGLHLEGQFESVFQALGETSTRTFALGKPVKIQGYTFGGFTLSEEFQDVDDPHFWFDPRNWQISVEALAEELGQLDPGHADLYAERAAAYNEELQILYEWGLAAFDQIPEEQRVLVTSHDAFQYFSDAYGFDVSSIQGLSTADEAGVGDIQEVVNFVIERKIPVMFVESSVAPNTIQSVQEAVAAQGWEVQIGVRELFGDAMGETDRFGGTYIGMIAQNIITILQSFGYDVPEWPDGLEPLPPTELLILEHN